MAERIPDLWDDIQLLGSARTGATAPPFSLYRGGLYKFEFPANALDELHGSLELPHTYKEGTDLKLHVHWRTNSTSALGGGIVWGFEYTFTNAAPGTLEPAPTTATYTEVVPAVSQQYLQHSTDLVTIPGAGIKVSALLSYRFFRAGADPADTYPASVWIDAFSLHFQKDADGSSKEWTKY